jgi:hypothetical protein
LQPSREGLAPAKPCLPHAFALSLLTAVAGVACNSQSDLLKARDGGGDGVSAPGAAGAGGGGGNAGSSVGGGRGGAGLGGSGGGTPPPPAPSHARATDPGLPPGRWVDRTPCRIQYVWPPALRGEARAVFDADRGRVVVIGTWANQVEVWEIDPATSAWYDRTPCRLPEFWPLVLGLLGYDRSRHKVVMLGGGETWEWDGQAGTWELRAPSFPEGIGPGSDATTTVLEWDARRRTLVLPGQNLLDWDGAAGTWTVRWTAPMGGARTPFSSYAAAAYDPDRERLLIFGGAAGSTYSNELWETDGVSWTNRTPSPLPASWPTGRSGARLLYEPVTRKTILAGGGDPAIPLGSSFDELWAFDATTATFTAAPPDPASWPPQTGFAATAGGGRVLLFGGASDLHFGHILSWDVAGGGPVTDLRPAHVPVSWPTTDHFAAAYDVRRDRVVMFGGWGDATTNGTSANLLEWNGQDGTWQDRTVARTAQVAWPPSRRHHVMAADSRRGLILIFGGDQLLPDDHLAPPAPFLGPKLSDYWEWDGQAGTFAQRSPAAADADWPPTGADHADTNAAMTYDEARDRVVLVGGLAGNPWEWDPVAGVWTRPPGPGIWNASSPGLIYNLREATTFLVQAENGGAPEIDSWDPGARSWTNRLTPMAVGPRWSGATGAVADPISGLVWVAAGTVWSWQAGATTWTDRSSVAMPPSSGNPVTGGVLIFDERRGTLVLLGQSSVGIGVWELALP